MLSWLLGEFKQAVAEILASDCVHKWQGLGKIFNFFKCTLTFIWTVTRKLIKQFNDLNFFDVLFIAMVYH